MRSRFDEELRMLNKELIEMGALCEDAIELIAKALETNDEDVYKVVRPISVEIDHKERDIESRCMKLLLQQQPVAKDLRLISAALKMITDMERIGDQAEDIVEIVPYMTAHPDEKFPKIREMAKAAQAMVTEAVDAYVKQDLDMARKVMAHDDVVDNYFSQIKSGIIDIIAAARDDESLPYRGSPRPAGTPLATHVTTPPTVSPLRFTSFMTFSISAAFAASGQRTALSSVRERS